jgi:RNA polymerase sigma-70 factor (ECF subfamily)
VDDSQLVDELRAGNEAAFAALVRLYQPRLLRFAETMVPSRAIAEEAVQDTWLGVVRGVHGFEGRSSVKTWLFRILVNRARSAGTREPRTVPLDDTRGDVDGERFDQSGAWAEPPSSWSDAIDDRLVAERVAARVRECLPTLPAGQREVVMLRDVEGLSPADACAVLGITDGHQRVLLHRGRAHIRRYLEERMDAS